MNDLTQQQCEACRIGAPKVTEAERAELLPKIPDWKIERDGHLDKLKREYRFDDYPKALVADLQGAGLFSNASFAPSEGDADYVVQGTIVTTKYDGRLWSYGLGPAGPILWLFALPAASASNTLAVELSCTDRRSGKQILSKRYAPPTYDSRSNLYARESDFEFAALLASVNREFTEDLRAALP